MGQEIKEYVIYRIPGIDEPPDQPVGAISQKDHKQEDGE
jgi:hypothetical protein